MAFITRDQIKNIIQNRPSDINSEDIINTLIQRGHQLEGYNQNTPQRSLNIGARFRQRMEEEAAQPKTAIRQAVKAGGLPFREGATMRPIRTSTDQYVVQLLKSIPRGVAQLAQSGQAIMHPLVAPLVKKITGKELPRDIISEEIIRATKPVTPAEEAGQLTSEIAQYFIPGKGPLKLQRAIQESKVLAKLSPVLQKILKLSGRAGVEGVTAGGITALQKGGKIDEDVGFAAGIGAAFPIAGAGIKKLTAPQGFMRKAMGLTPTQSRNLTNIAKSGGYKSVDDFALEKGLSGDRNAMADQADDLFHKTIDSKSELLKNVTEQIDNTYQEAFDYLKKEYSVPGQKEALERITELSKKVKLTASELDEVRYLMDKSMPRTAYTDKTRAAVEGLENLVDPMRRTLERVDKTGVLKKINTDIRILYKLMPNLAQSANRNVINQLLFRNIGRLGVTGSASFVNPELAALTGALSVIGGLTDIPQISSALANILKKARVKNPNQFLQRIFGPLEGKPPSPFKSGGIPNTTGQVKITNIQKFEQVKNQSMKVIDKIEELASKVKKEDKGMVKMAIDTVDNIHSDFATKDLAIDSVRKAGYGDLAHYLDLLDAGYFEVKLPKPFKTGGKIPSTALIEEAKKYKSAEEFVNSHQRVFRGGEKFDPAKMNDAGTPFSIDNKVAEQFARIKNQSDAGVLGQLLGKAKGQNIIESFYVSPNAKIATRKDFPDDVFNTYKQADPLTKPEIAEPIINKWAKKNGFDGIDYRTLGKTSAKEAEIKVLNPDVIKTKPQLIDIWNKAHFQ